VEGATLWKTGFTLTSKVSSEMVLEIPELAQENQNWKIYRCHAPNRFGTVNMEDNVNIK